MTLFPKLALMTSGLMAATTLTLSSAYYWHEKHNLEAELSNEQHMALHNLVHIAQESFLTNDDLLVVKYVRGLPQWTPGLQSASVIDTAGEVIADSQPSSIGREEEIHSLSNDTLVLTDAVMLGTENKARASLAFSKNYSEHLLAERTQTLRTELLKLMVGPFGIAVLICLGMARSWTLPITQLVKAAEEVGKGKWAVSLGDLPYRADELGILSKRFLRMTDELRQLDQMKEDFVSAVTHELRSPLGAIESYLNLIHHEMKAGTPLTIWETYIQRLRMNTERLTRFVNDLLDVAALDRGSLTLDKQVIDFSSIAKEVLTLFQPTFESRGMTTQFSECSPCPTILGDADRLRQVITNLLSNALKFTPDHGHIEISIEHDIPHQALRVCVSDSGLGIPFEQQQKLFQKFEQVKGSRQQVKGAKGTGLGLAITRALVELHGGTIGVQSQPGNGSTFWFTIPLKTMEVPSRARVSLQEVL